MWWRFDPRAELLMLAVLLTAIALLTIRWMPY
jgi:hypothetical protein